MFRNIMLGIFAAITLAPNAPPTQQTPLKVNVDLVNVLFTVTDASGAGVPNAAVSVVNERTGQERKVNGDAAGYFVVPSLSSSTYKVSVEGNGFAKWEATGIPISVGQ